MTSTRRWLVILTALAIGLAGGGEAAIADTPDFSAAYLTATKVLTPPAGSDDIPLTALSFDSGAGTTAVIHVYRSGRQFDRIVGPGGGSKGTKTYPIEPGYSYVFRLTAVWIENGVSRVKTLERLNIRTLPCIKSLGVVPRGLRATIDVDTEVPT